MSVGDPVLINGKYAADGFYTFLNDNTYKGFSVINGKVSSIKEKSLFLTIVIIVIVFITSMIVVIYFNGPNKSTNSNTSTTNTDTSSMVVDTNRFVSHNYSSDTMDTSLTPVKLQSVKMETNLSNEKKESVIPNNNDP